ncbi:16S rRNA (uracil(1498)-N(3))-methyltransferase [Pseudenhygromyxa sp. WMMC2535]|uniref:RsmE family RNA methyltransferase n=1 Tax=Pseudenhygromyxa sp. WMMC2535 TaxID=2712867 RepID=UPI001556E645|nr:RsmE family RNA methyltransferase [Pseudenhygromyxa sp. WMMC2535]NVB40092.1 16S rRNA (uracil(1498)-N(3))-methyltransferase [Pseudenhygromyxa sp. WMMC2535]
MSVRAFADTGASAGASDGLQPGARLRLDAEESRYLLKVRRLRPDDRFELFDGAGGLWRARVLGADGGRGQVEVEVEVLVPTPQLPERVLLLGIPDTPATLESLTAASELAATEVILIRCARSQGRVPSVQRVDRVLRAAQRQCGRPRAPRILGLDEPWPLARALAHRADLPGWFAWERERGPEAAQNVPASASIEPGLRLLVGPEGGLDAAEVEALRASGFSPLGLGPWVLRTPTAVVAGLTRLLR